MLFFVGVPLFSFLLEIFSTLLTLHCLTCIFHMIKHINKVVNVMFVENISIWNVTSENIAKKVPNFFGFYAEMSIFLTTFTKLNRLSNGQFFQWSLLILYFPKSLGPLGKKTMKNWQHKVCKTEEEKYDIKPTIKSR